MWWKDATNYTKHCKSAKLPWRRNIKFSCWSLFFVFFLVFVFFVFFVLLSFCLFVYLSFCLFVYLPFYIFVLLSGHDCGQISEGSQVSKVARAAKNRHKAIHMMSGEQHLQCLHCFQDYLRSIHWSISVLFISSSIWRYMQLKCKVRKCHFLINSRFFVWITALWTNQTKCLFLARITTSSCSGNTCAGQEN